MKIIYSCYGGAHTSIVAAAIHMGILPIHRIPSYQEIVQVPFYDATETKDIGQPIFMGIDQRGNQVFVMGMGSNRGACASLLYDYVNLVHPSYQRKILIVNSIALINLPIRIGGFLSRKLRLITIGKPLTVFGIIKKYESFVLLVNNVKRAI